MQEDVFKPVEQDETQEVRSAHRDFWRATIWILIFNGLFALCVLCKAIPHATRVAIDNLAGAIGPLLAGLWCLFAGWQRRKQPGISGPPRLWRAPLFLGLGSISYAIGEAIWCYYELVLHRETPFPSWADVGYLGAYPFWLIGVFLLPTRPISLATRIKALLDSLMSMTAVIAFSWYFILGPTLLKGSETLLGKILAAAYPLADLGLAFCVLLLTSGANERLPRKSVRLLTFSFSVLIVTDTLFAYGTLRNTYATGGLIDVGWPLSIMFICLAGKIASQVTTPVFSGKAPLRVDDTILPPRSLSFVRALLPYALIPLVAALLFYTLHTRGDEQLEPGVCWGGIVLVLLILARQLFALAENHRLYGDLHQAYREKEAANQTLAEANVRLQALATTDSMTGLANHRAFQERLRNELEQAAGTPRTLLLMDVDQFKQYNDAYGHPAGDELLRLLAPLLVENVRAEDFVARYGGEEFAVLMPCDLKTGVEVAEQLRRAVEAYLFPYRTVTLSIGVAQCADGHESPESLVARADQALYRAKHAGRNCVACSEDQPLKQTVWTSHLQDISAHLTLFDGRSSYWKGLLQKPEGQLLLALSATLDLHDAETEGHSQRVVCIVERLAQELAHAGRPLTNAEWQQLMFGALLHDIGKLGVSSAILHKPGPLTEAEATLMRRHPELGASLLANFPALTDAIPVVRHHHERWDGAGYPGRLAGNAIPLVARLFALADTFDAMAFDRPYRKALPLSHIRMEIAGQAGKQFDPELTQLFLNLSNDVWERFRFVDSLPDAIPSQEIRLKAA